MLHKHFVPCPLDKHKLTILHETCMFSLEWAAFFLLLLRSAICSRYCYCKQWSAQPWGYNDNRQIKHTATESGRKGKKGEGWGKGKETINLPLTGMEGSATLCNYRSEWLRLLLLACHTYSARISKITTILFFFFFTSNSCMPELATSTVHTCQHQGVFLLQSQTPTPTQTANRQCQNTWTFNKLTNQRVSWKVSGTQHFSFTLPQKYNTSLIVPWECFQVAAEHTHTSKHILHWINEPALHTHTHTLTTVDNSRIHSYQINIPQIFHPSNVSLCACIFEQ